MKRFVFSIFLIICLFACKPKEQEDCLILKVQLEDKGVSFYDLFERLELIPLEANDNSLIKQIADLYVINDTLFVFDRYNPNSLKQTVFKYKIVEVDSLKLILKEIPTRFMDTLVFNKITRTKKNDLKFERIDFYGSGGIGPALSLSIESDSIMYQYSYANTRHRGVSKYKLSPFEFSRIQTKLNYIDWNNVVMESPWPSSGYYMLFIKTANDSIELDGRSSNNEDLNDFLAYLKHLERFLNLTSIENQEVYFRYGRWGELN